MTREEGDRGEEERGRKTESRKNGNASCNGLEVGEDPGSFWGVAATPQPERDRARVSKRERDAEQLL